MSPSNAALLTEQHRAIELGINGLVDGSGSREELHEGVFLLRKHIYVEEVALFPILDQDQRYWKALAQMRWEHGDMWPHLENCVALLERRAFLDDFMPDATILVRLLRVHDRKEEEAIYAAADRYVVDASHPPLADYFADLALPAGWRCLRAPDASGKPGDALVG